MASFPIKMVMFHHYVELPEGRSAYKQLTSPVTLGWLLGSPPVNEDVRQHATAKAAQFAPTQHAIPQP